jgi:hypothetical protein
MSIENNNIVKKLSSHFSAIVDETKKIILEEKSREIDDLVKQKILENKSSKKQKLNEQEKTENMNNNTNREPEIKGENEDVEKTLGELEATLESLELESDDEIMDSSDDELNIDDTFSSLDDEFSEEDLDSLVDETEEFELEDLEMSDNETEEFELEDLDSLVDETEEFELEDLDSEFSDEDLDSLVDETEEFELEDLDSEFSDEDLDSLVDETEEFELEDDIEESLAHTQTHDNARKAGSHNHTNYGKENRLRMGMAESKLVRDLKIKLTESKKENEALKGTTKKLSQQLKEMAISNTNLTLATKLLIENSVTKNEKIRIIEKFKNIKTIDESKSAYKSLLSDIKSDKTITETIEEKTAKVVAPSSKIVESTAFDSGQSIDSISKINKLMEYMDVRDSKTKKLI